MIQERDILQLRCLYSWEFLNMISTEVNVYFTTYNCFHCMNFSKLAKRE